jgi:hypothetical protein
VDFLQPLGRKAAQNRFDLSPLQERVAALYFLEHTPRRRPDPQAQLQLIADPANPRMEVLDDIRRRRADAIAAARRDITDPPPAVRVTVVREPDPAIQLAYEDTLRIHHRKARRS